MDLHARVEHDLSWHPPKTGAVSDHLDIIREMAKEFAHTVVNETPASREQSLALTAIEEATQWAIAAVVRNQS